MFLATIEFPRFTVPCSFRIPPVAIKPLPVFAVTVLLLSVNTAPDPEFLMPPVSSRNAVFPLTVLLVKVKVAPEFTLAMPPLSLPLTVLRVTVAVPPVFRMPPPPKSPPTLSLMVLSVTVSVPVL